MQFRPNIDRFISNESTKSKLKLPTISDEQKAVVDSLSDNNVMVDSVAGSGKTTTALHIAKRYSDANILLLTYNSRLKIETRQKVKILGLDNMEVHSYHAFCVKYYVGYDAITDKGIYKTIDNDVDPVTKFKYDIIIIDEAQDITRLFYRLINKIDQDNINKNCKYCIIGDKYQCIFKDLQNSDKRFLIYADKLFNFNKLPWVKKKLSTSYRITSEMAQFINTCVLKEHRIKSDKKGDNTVNYMIINSFSTYDTYSEIVRYFNNGYGPGDIFILAPSIKNRSKNSKRKSPLAKLENKISQNYPVYVPINDDQNISRDVTKDKIVISTFHQIKGMERPIVILFNFDNSYFTHYNKTANKNFCPDILYVALTRASEHISIYHSCNEDYLPFINKDQVSDYIRSSKPIKLRKNKKTGTIFKNTSPTDLVSYLQSDIITNALNFIKITKLEEPQKFINIPIKIRVDNSIEEVSEINGLAIPFYFEYLMKGHITLLKNESMDELPISKLLLISNSWNAKKTKYQFKLRQIKKYDWMTKEQLDCAVNRLKRYIDKSSKFECKFGLCDKEELEDYDLHGFIDCITDDTVWEFKCCTTIKDEHILQLAIYMYVYKTLHPERSDMKYKLINILSNEVYELSADYELLKKMIKYLIKQRYYINQTEIEDKEFISNILKLNDAYVNSEERKYTAILDIETNSVFPPVKIIQIAYWIYDEENKKIISKQNLIIRNDANLVDYFKQISLGDMAYRGKRLGDALKILRNDLNKCKYIVGHNIHNFDLKHINNAFDKCFIKYELPIVLDTMRLTKNLINVKNKNGGKKAPKLEEVFKFICKKDVDVQKQHDAFYDVEITFECYKKLREDGKIPLN